MEDDTFETDLGAALCRQETIPGQYRRGWQNVWRRGKRPRRQGRQTAAASGRMTAAAKRKADAPAKKREAAAKKTPAEI
jgi:hypothetical protein